MKYVAHTFFICIVTLLFSCCDDSSNYVNSDWMLSANTRFLELDKTEVVIGADRNLSQSIKVSSVNTRWTLMGGDTWVTASQSSGNGDAEITLTATENTSVDDIRTCIFSLSSTEVDYSWSYPISVTQCSVTPYITPNVQTLQFTREASSQHIEIAANTQWEATTSADWVIVTADKDYSGLSVSVAENESTKDRDATVVIDGKTKATISVHQFGTQFDDLITSLHFGNHADSQSVNIETDGRWTASANKSWISLSSMLGSGTSSLTISVTDNSGENERDGVITVSVGESMKQILVVQSGTYINVVPPSDMAIPSRGGSHSVSFETSDDWSATSKSSWVQLNPTSGTAGQQVLTIQAGDNPSSEERFDTTYVISSNPNLQAIRIITKQAGRYFIATADNLSFERDGGTTTIFIDSDDDWEVTSCPAWINMSVMQGNESKSIVVTVADNKTENQREGTIEINSSFCGKRSFLVSQTNNHSWLSFTSDGAQTLHFSSSVPTLEYSVNGSEWQSLGTKKVSFGGDRGELRLRGKSSYGTAKSDYNYAYIEFGNNNKVSCQGDIRTLINYEKYTTVDCQNARFCMLFKNCSSLTTSPQLPATTLANSCYSSMFQGCSSLTSAPQLPATTLADLCYGAMFEGCTSLIQAPELPSTTLAYGCYATMFHGCSSLTTAPQLPATTLASDCYNSMFDGCNSLTSAPQLPATTLAKACYLYMFKDCNSLTTAPQLPATTLANSCYSSMFQGCISLTTAPQLPATTLADGCYSYMFRDCISLVTAPQLLATTLAEGCCFAMFDGCSSLVTAPQLLATTLADHCYSYMFHDCSSLTTAPQLLATTLVDDCYYCMFYRCNNLNYIKMMAIDISATDCLAGWTWAVHSTGTFVKNAKATWNVTGKDGVPSGWTVFSE